MFEYTIEVDKGARKLVESYLISYFGFLTDRIKDENKIAESTEDMLKGLFPAYLLSNDIAKCVKTVLEIDTFLTDEYHHKFDSIHEYPIQVAFSEIEDRKKELGDDFWLVYYSSYTKNGVATLVRRTFGDDIKETERNEKRKMTQDELLKQYIDAECFSSICFQDSDCLFIEEILSLKSPEMISELCQLEGIDPEYYYDLIPSDIAERLKHSNDVLKQFLCNLRSTFEKSTFRLTKINDFKEKDFQLLFELYAKGFCKVGFESPVVLREEDVGNAKIDFSIILDDYGQVVFEIKNDSLHSVKKAIDYQIPEYMKRTNSKIAVCLIFSADGIKNEKYYMSICKKRNTDSSTIIPFIIDYSAKLAPSK